MENYLIKPGFLSVHSTPASDISFLFALLFTSLFLRAGFLAYKGRGLAHHRMILFSAVTMAAYFVFYYQFRRLGLASMTDQISFLGPPWVYSYIFKPTLYLHFIAVTMVTCLSIYMIIDGFRVVARRDDKMVLKSGDSGRSSLLWGLGFVWLAFIVWWAFGNPRFSMGHRVMFLSLGYLLPAVAAWLIVRRFPDRAHRHRNMGRICLMFFMLLFSTNLMVYSLLYLLF